MLKEFEKLTGSTDSLDDILKEVKSFGASQPETQSAASGTWSMDEIDKLLMDTGSRVSARSFVDGPVKVEAKPEKVQFEAKKTMVFPHEDVPVESYFPKVAKVAEPQNPSFVTEDKEEINEIENILSLELSGRKVKEQKTEAPVKKYEKIPEYDPMRILEERKKSEKPAIESDKNRESFLKALVLERTAEIDEDAFGPVDTPGIIIEKSAVQATSELSPLPKVISAEGILNAESQEKTIIAGAKKAPVKEETPVEEEYPGQLRLSGFEELSSESEPEKAEEISIETSLRQRRRKIAEEFKVVNLGGEEEKMPDFKAQPLTAQEKKRIKQAEKEEKQNKEKTKTAAPRRNEYISPKLRNKFYGNLVAQIKEYRKQLLLTFATAIGMVFFLVLPDILESLHKTSELFGAGAPGIYVANAILLVILLAVNSQILSQGLSNVIKKAPDAQSAAALSAAVAFAHNTITAVAQSNSRGVTELFGLAAAAGFGAVTLAKRIDLGRILANFRICAYKYDKGFYCVHPFEVEAEIMELSRHLLLERANLLYSSKGEFPQDFMKNSRNSKTEQKTVRLILPLAAIASVISAAVCAIVTREWLDALTAFAGTFCVCSPVFASLAPAVLTRAANRRLNYEGAMISSLDSAQKISAANGVVLDSADVFDRAHCRMHGMIDFEKVRIDDVIVYAAAMVIKSGGPLRECFEQVISCDRTLLPTVRDFVYEDKLGVSARIHNQKVLLGNRALLEHHSVAFKENFSESKYTHSGRKVIYLAVNGELAAVFVVSYAPDNGLADYIKALDENDTKILVRTNDVNISEDLLAKSFNLPKQAFSVLGAVASRLFKRRRDSVSETLEADIVHDGTAYTMLRCVAAAQKMCKVASAALVAQAVVCAVGFALCTVLAALSSSLFSGVAAVVFLALSAAAVIGVSGAAKPD